MKTKFSLPLLLIAGLFTFSGCENEEEVAKISGNTALLTSSPWYIVKHAVSPAVDTDSDGNFEDDLTHKNEPWQKDDFEMFYPNGTYKEDEGPTKGSIATLQILKSGTWAFIANETKLEISVNGPQPYISPYSVTFDLVTLTNSALVLQSQYRKGNDTITETLTYRH